MVLCDATRGAGVAEGGGTGVPSTVKMNPPPPTADLVIRHSAVLLQFGRLVHDIDAAHPMRLAFAPRRQICFVDASPRMMGCGASLRKRKATRRNAEAVALLEMPTVLGPALVGLAELLGDRLP